MHVITSVAELQAKIDECNRMMAEGSDAELRHLFNSFRMDMLAVLPADPFSTEYAACQDSLYQAISGRPYSLENERSVLNPAARPDQPFPYYLRSTSTAGHHLLAIGFLLCKLELPSGARVVEFGPGWGNTTLELARNGLDVTAVDIEPQFCRMIRARAETLGVRVNVVEADFFWAEGVTEPFDAAIFFECFHHCHDHMRLLRALRRAVKPGGQVYIASEPIFPAYPVPWGVRMDGEALWAMRNFGWLELGFVEAYFREALARTGWIGVRHACQDVHWASVWQLRPSEETTLLSPGTYPPIRGNAAAWDGLAVPADLALPHELPPEPAPGPEPSPALHRSAEVERLQRELEAVRHSTSWRLTRPVRGLKRMVNWFKTKK